jgi:penicillin-binding protein 1A
MLWGYSIFPGHGFSTKPYFISRIEDRNGNVIKRFDYSSNRKEAISEVTAYNMTRLMEGPVTKGTAAGLMYRLGASEMGGKTGTTQGNADAWFIGYSPQLLAGTWIGCDDRFIRIESGEGYGGLAARPIWESFFKKVYADKTLGIDQKAVFQKPADLQNQMLDADISGIIESAPDAGAEGTDVGAGNASDYGLDESFDTIGAESQRPPEDSKLPPKDKPKKDTSAKKPVKIGEATVPEEEKKEKKGILQNIFGGKKNKDKKEDSKPENDY